jgi:hypothetical protein
MRPNPSLRPAAFNSSASALAATGGSDRGIEEWSAPPQSTKTFGRFDGFRFNGLSL